MSSNRSSTPPTEPATLLVHVTGDRVGDALLKYPALRALRAACPALHVTWTSGLRSSVFAGRLAPLAAGLIDEIHPASGLGQRLFAPLPAFLSPHYDAIVASEARLIPALVMRRIPCARFVSPVWGFLLSGGRPGAAYAEATAAERFAMLLSLAVDRPLTPVARIDIPQAQSAVAEALLPDGTCYVGFCPGAGGASKRWPTERYIELARRQAARGRVPVFFLGPEETGLRDEIVALVPAARLVEEEAEALGERNVYASIALARRLAVALSNDSGGGHLVAAGGRPMIKLYGHTDAHKFASPYGPQHALAATSYGGRDVAAIPLAAVDDALEAALAAA